MVRIRVNAFYATQSGQEKISVYILRAVSTEDFKSDKRPGEIQGAY